MCDWPEDMCDLRAEVCFCFIYQILLTRYDFFIVSQSVRQGSVAPTHFNVVYDTSALKPDHMQRLTYKLCHLYYNWQVWGRGSGEEGRAYNLCHVLHL